MAYKPPHRRVAVQGEPKPLPMAPPSYTSSSSRANPRSKGPGDSKPEVRISWIPGSISRNLFLLPQDEPPPSMQFVRFTEDTFGHLQDTDLYLLRPTNEVEKKATHEDFVTGSSKQAEVENVKDDGDSSKCLEKDRKNSCQNFSWDDIVQSLQADLAATIELVRTMATTQSSNTAVPKVVLRFGQFMFHKKFKSFNTSSCAFDFNRNYTLEAIEENIGKTHSKTFDNSLPRSFFTLLEERVARSEDAAECYTKEKFIIQMEDTRKKNYQFKCVCVIMDSTSESEQPNKPQLQLKEVKSKPLRCFVTDTACIGKDYDVRLMIYISDTLNNITEEEKSELEYIVSKACIDETAKGGLHWPLGSMDSPSKWFSAVGAWHIKSRYVKLNNVTWKFQQANRSEFKASSGRVTYEGQVRPTMFNEYVQGGKEWDQLAIISSINTLIESALKSV